MDVASITAELIKIHSPSGKEHQAVNYVEAILKGWGFNVRRLPVGDGRDNLLATRGRPRTLLSTHLDIVPAPEALFTPRIEAGRLIGRGACDAKGTMASMLCALKRLSDEGLDDVGLLAVVGEEWGGDGARAAAKALEGTGVEWVINGEPTEGKLMRGHKGTIFFELHCEGRACHSGYPQLGESAISKLISILNQLEHAVFGTDPVLGATTLNIGQISGGVAMNVLAPHAQAGVLIRNVQPCDQLMGEINRIVGSTGRLEKLDLIDPVWCHTVPGFETDVAAYCTDIPNLTALGSKFLLYGPGSIFVAHTDHESVGIDELNKAVDDYCRLVKLLR